MRPLLVSLLVAVAACGDGNNNAPPVDAGSDPACSDGIDNDGDGTVDFPDDLGCSSQDAESEDGLVAPACADQRDNDGDGKTDYPEDPGCPIPQADREDDDCPTGPGCPQCADGFDNDNSGSSDFPGDRGCAAAGDNTEFVDDSVACGADLVIKQLPRTGVETGTLAAASTSSVSSPCGGGGGRPAVAYVFYLAQPKVVVASTDSFVTTVDTVLDLRSAMCQEATAEIACSNDISATNKRSRITRSLPAGTYYLIVQGATTAAVGPYSLAVQFLAGEGSTCTNTAQCGPGLVCRTPVGSTTQVCSQPVCNDTLDDDGDGKIDYPDDPGCLAPADDTETDVCATAPTDPACPACSNGLDDDGDGDIDYPADPGCIAASTARESCLQAEPILVATAPQTAGTTVGATNDFTPPPGPYNGHACSTTGTHSAPDVAIQLDLPATTSLNLRLTAPSGTLFNSAHILLDASCAGAPIDCSDNPSMTLVNRPAGRYYMIVDGFSTASGAFTLNITGAIANGESCETPLAQPGGLACGAGHSCKGAVGSRTCQPAECNDGVDNNGAGGTDYPDDPGCLSKDDDSETTVCPGATCPVCADGLDNDGDTLIDYPADPGCVAASATNEGCAETDGIVEITAPTTTGTLVGAVDDHNPSCVTSNLADKIFTLDIPSALQSLVIDTEGSAVDTVLSLMDSSCGEPSIACDDDGGVGTGDSLISRGFVSPGLYSIAVDSDSTTLDTFVLHVSGTVLPGGSCEGALFQAGVFVCPIGLACNGAPGARKCTAAQCLDGADNNGDGKTDFPNDPGCDSPADSTETTVCPGAACPVCADGLDNDGDGDIDFPDDSGCSAASGANEGCFDTDPIVELTTATTISTLAGATNDHTPSCVTSTTPVGVDRIFTLDVPALQSLTIDTEGSVGETVLSFMTSACAAPNLACDDDGGVGTGDSLITRGFVAAGSYAIGVDADTGTADDFILNVAGVIVPGGSCEGPLAQAGALSCSLGFACGGAPGSRTCVAAQCLDGIDNNSDGDIDFPDDPGCDSPSDDTETTVCPGPECPVCADGLDNDGDGDTDYPADANCMAASSTSEACLQSEPIGAITQPVTTGTTIGAVNDYVPVCGSTTHNAPDLVYQLELPAMVSLNLDVAGFDTAHSLLDSTCGGTPIECSDPAKMPLTNIAAGTYYLVIEGWSTLSGPFTLNTSGTVAPGESCEGALFQSGAFACSNGHLCAGPAGARTCSPAQCNDGLDNNADGAIDYPFDPGCATQSDDTEATVCPGPDCPVCSNTVDDDSDTFVDFPMDLECSATGGTSEVFCPLETNPVVAITAPQTASTLVSMTDNYEQSCAPTTVNDRAFALRLPVPVATLVIDTIGSTASNTIVSMWDASCATELGCDDDGAPGLDLRSRLLLVGVAAGNYAIQVDSTATNSAFVLNVKGTVAAGTVCTSPLFTTGVLVCPTGATCTTGTCQ